MRCLLMSPLLWSLLTMRLMRPESMGMTSASLVTVVVPAL